MEPSDHPAVYGVQMKKGCFSPPDTMLHNNVDTELLRKGPRIIGCPRYEEWTLASESSCAPNIDDRVCMRVGAEKTERSAQELRLTQKGPALTRPPLVFEIPRSSSFHDTTKPLAGCV